MYLSWAGYFEGDTDREYFGVLLPRVMEDIVRTSAIRNVTIPENFLQFGADDRSVEAVSSEVCQNYQAFHIWFIHADVGGRALAENIESRSTAYKNRAHAICNFPLERAIVVAPMKETEAWVLADDSAVLSAFGISSNREGFGIPTKPSSCERLQDPKETFNEFARSINRRRYRNGASFLFPIIALNQDLEKLRQLESFQNFERDLKSALASLGCISIPQM